jgi:hypothetical protein
MEIEYRIRSPRLECLLFAGVYIGLAVLGVSWIRYSSAGMNIRSVLSICLLGVAPAWLLWLAIRPIGDRVLIKVTEDHTSISRNDVEVFSGRRLSQSEVVEDGVAFHFSLPNARCAFTLPKKHISEEAIKCLQRT